METSTGLDKKSVAQVLTQAGARLGSRNRDKDDSSPRRDDRDNKSARRDDRKEDGRNRRDSRGDSTFIQPKSDNRSLANYMDIDAPTTTTIGQVDYGVTAMPLPKKRKVVKK